MKTLRRLNLTQTYYFLTLVTLERKPILVENAAMFWASWPGKKPLAWAIMPDHFHVLCYCADQPLSSLIHDFKITFARRYRDKFGPGRVWQNRFWDHAVRNEEDFKRHFDYIHFNPVHHGLVQDTAEYPYTSFHKWLARGNYEPGWGKLEFDVKEFEFGE